MGDLHGSFVPFVVHIFYPSYSIAFLFNKVELEICDYLSNLWAKKDYRKI